MSYIQELIGKIEKNIKKSDKKSEMKNIYSKNSEQKKEKSTSLKHHNKKYHRDSSQVFKGKKNKANKNENKKKRFFVVDLCMSKKSCATNTYAPYVWERLCNDYDQDPECDFFEIQGFRFEKSSMCLGACKKPANIRIKEKTGKNFTQFSYITPIKASKLIKMIKSGASPENIKKL